MRGIREGRRLKNLMNLDLLLPLSFLRRMIAGSGLGMDGRVGLGFGIDLISTFQLIDSVVAGSIVSADDVRPRVD